jgi:hypothetical protein
VPAARASTPQPPRCTGNVENKDNLLLLATDHVWGELDLPDLDSADRRAMATAMATDLYRMFLRHPWLVQAFAAHVLYGENKARHDDHSLALHETAGITAAEAAVR